MIIKIIFYDSAGDVILDERRLLLIAGRLSIEEGEKLGFRLHLSKAKLDQIKSRHHQATDINFTILKYWRDASHHRNILDTLASALSDIGREEVGQELITTFKGNHSHSQAVVS